MEIYSLMGLVGIILIVIGSIAFCGLVYPDIKKNSKIKLKEIRNFSYPKRGYYSERLGTTDVIRTL